jgi:hypothetical protein
MVLVEKDHLDTANRIVSFRQRVELSLLVDVAISAIYTGHEDPVSSVDVKPFIHALKAVFRFKRISSEHFLLCRSRYIHFTAQETKTYATFRHNSVEAENSLYIARKLRLGQTLRKQRQHSNNID